jgi:hypothetical protein
MPENAPHLQSELALGLLFIVDERKHDRLSSAVDACDISRIDRLASSPTPSVSLHAEAGYIHKCFIYMAGQACIPILFSLSPPFRGILALFS